MVLYCIATIIGGARVFAWGGGGGGGGAGGGGGGGMYGKMSLWALRQPWKGAQREGEGNLCG